VLHNYPFDDEINATSVRLLKGFYTAHRGELRNESEEEREAARLASSLKPDTFNETMAMLDRMELKKKIAQAKANKELIRLYALSLQKKGSHVGPINFDDFNLDPSKAGSSPSVRLA